MDDNEYYFIWRPLLAGFIKSHLPDYLLWEGDRPKMIERQKPNGKYAKCYVATDPQYVRQYIHDHYVNQGFPEIEENMKEFLNRIKEVN